MAQTGFLWLINATSKALKAINTSSYQMNAWEFSDIPSQSHKKFCIAYRGDNEDELRDSTGETAFQLDGTDITFQLLIRWPKKEGECGLKVDWGGITTGGYQVFPPALEGERFGKLGWIHNGSLSLLIMENGVATSVSTHLPGEDSIVSSASTEEFYEAPVYKNWMEHYCGVLEKLTLAEMTLPGTHNSGTCQLVSGFGTTMIQTQDHSLHLQLKYGIRALDLSIGQTSPGNYILCYDAWRTSYSLEEALTEVKDFIDSSKKEVVVLDFHRFVNLGSGSYDYIQLKQQVTSALSGYTLSASRADDTLAAIWSSPESKKGRVVVAWNVDNPESYMWPGVNQRWYEDANTLSKLYQCIKDDMPSPLAGLRATCSFVAGIAPRYYAKASYSTLTNWYFGCSEFCDKANIISVDFFRKFTNIVQASIIASLLKTGKKT